MSKGSSRRRPPVTWNPARTVWETDTLGLYCGHAEPYLGTWPASGSMRNGVASEQTKSAPRTAGAASSSAPGRLLSTPVASDGGTDRGSSAGWGLRDETRKLLPTPRTSDTNGIGTHGDGGMDLRTAVSLLPTPTTGAQEKSTRALTSSSENGRRSGGGQSSSLGLTEVAKLVSGERPKNLPPIEKLPPASREIVEKLLPTPAASFPGTTANFRPDGTPYSEGYGMTLLDAVRLLPTPTNADGERTSSSYGRGNPTLTGAITNPPSDGGSESLDVPPPGPLTLWDD